MLFMVVLKRPAFFGLVSCNIIYITPLLHLCPTTSSKWPAISLSDPPNAFHDEFVLLYSNQITQW